MDFKLSLTAETQTLYEKLKAAGAQINFEIDNAATCWSVREIPTFIISATSADANKAAMAHELSHIELSLNGFSSLTDIYIRFNEKNSICTPEFINDLNNNLAHFTMLDNFLSMGFSIDDFLQDTPKKYLTDGMLIGTVAMVLGHKTGINETMQETRDIILMCASAKLFEMYKVKDPTTTNGMHPSLIMDPLKEINVDLVNGLDTLFNDWRDAKSVDNLEFFRRLYILLKDMKILEDSKTEPIQIDDTAAKSDAGV
jgi:hypothetical protein